MRRTRLVVLLASAAAVLTACNAITGASDLTADLCSDCGEDASVVTIADSATDRTKPESNDGGVDSGEASTFCDGLVLYTTYDNDLRSTVGSSLLTTTKDTLVAGKFGKGLQALGTTSTAYYPMGGDAGTLYPEKAGTIAFWFKSGLAISIAKADRILVKPVIDPVASVNETAPQIRFDGDEAVLGITNQNPDAGYTTAGVAVPNDGVPVGWKQLDFNHLIGSWNRENKSLRFWLNGGTAPGTSAESNTEWIPQVSPTGFLRISSSVSPSEGVFDELAMWSRELRAEEVQALFGSPISIADACGL